MINRKRPKFLSLHQIRIPLPGVISILHRISGALLFLVLPGLLWMLQASLRSAETCAQLTELLQHPLSKLVSIGLLWAFLHHACAGLRLLAIDLGWASSLRLARLSSRWVLVVSLTLTLLLGVLIW